MMAEVSFTKRAAAELSRRFNGLTVRSRGSSASSTPPSNPSTPQPQSKGVGQLTSWMVEGVKKQQPKGNKLAELLAGRPQTADALWMDPAFLVNFFWYFSPLERTTLPQGHFRGPVIDFGIEEKGVFQPREARFSLSVSVRGGGRRCVRRGQQFPPQLRAPGSVAGAALLQCHRQGTRGAARVLPRGHAPRDVRLQRGDGRRAVGQPTSQARSSHARRLHQRRRRVRGRHRPALAQPPGAESAGISRDGLRPGLLWPPAEWHSPGPEASLVLGAHQPRFAQPGACAAQPDGSLAVRLRPQCPRRTCPGQVCARDRPWSGLCVHYHHHPSLVSEVVHTAERLRTHARLQHEESGDSLFGRLLSADFKWIVFDYTVKEFTRTRIDKCSRRLSRAVRILEGTPTHLLDHRIEKSPSFENSRTSSVSNKVNMRAKNQAAVYDDPNKQTIRLSR
ncbi:hypothetical protein HNY73_017685 [Argiope bruennichi]|uniref:Uncharacterized protein n=1 Tax=Argiope bruennichi TaxID=94029 RepID=A0A8T0EDL7_ARGBR|nr:hypothetical protein HNY73_017685 [Argiope bruennichi]